MRRHRQWLAVSLAALVLTACGAAAGDTPVAAGDPGSSGTCLAGDEDCADDPSSGGGGEAPPPGELPSDAYVAVAKGMLGLSMEEYEATSWDVPTRVGRVGDEQYALTEDYVIGRMTAAFDDDGSGTMVITSVTVELEGGPEVVDSVEG
jgi:hypothetical protein